MKDRELPKGVADAIEAARLVLVAALRGGALKKAPNNAALAQAAFDCWMEEVSRKAPAETIQACRDSFDQALTRVEDALAAK